MALGGALLGPGSHGLHPVAFRVVVPISVDERISWLRGSCPLQANSHLKNDSLELRRQPALVKEPVTFQVSWGPKQSFANRSKGFVGWV